MNEESFTTNEECKIIKPIDYVDLSITGTEDNWVKIRSSNGTVEFGPNKNWNELAETFFNWIAKYGFNIKQQAVEEYKKKLKEESGFIYSTQGEWEVAQEENALEFDFLILEKESNYPVATNMNEADAEFVVKIHNELLK